MLTSLHPLGKVVSGSIIIVASRSCEVHGHNVQGILKKINMQAKTSKYQHEVRR